MVQPYSQPEWVVKQNSGLGDDADMEQTEYQTEVSDGLHPKRVLDMIATTWTAPLCRRPRSF
jgi:hypothetical protein